MKKNLFALLILFLPGSAPGLTPDVAATTQPAATMQPAEEIALSSAELTALQIDVLRAELDAMLLPSGLPITQEENSIDAKLVEVAIESGRVARNADLQSQQLEATNIEMRAYNALANTAMSNQRGDEAKLRIAQLRSTAEQAKQIGAPQAALTGDFWLINADLISIRQNNTDPLKQQQLAIERIEAFLTQSDQAAAEPDSDEQAIIADIQLGLLRLYEQAGESQKSCALLEQLKTSLAEDDPRRDSLQDSAATCARIGKPVHYALTGPDGHAWASDADRGRPVLLYLTAASAMPSTETLEMLHSDAVANEPAAPHLYLIIVGQTDTTVAPAGLEGWRLAAMGADDPLLADLGIAFLPRLVLVDGQGDIAAIGWTAAILKQLPSLEPEAPVQPGEKVTDHENIS
jgi:hypothetical protein